MSPDASTAAVHLRFPLLLADDFRQLLGASSEVKLPKDLSDSGCYPPLFSSMYKDISSSLDGASAISSTVVDAWTIKMDEGEHCISDGGSKVVGDVVVECTDVVASTPLFSGPIGFSFCEAGDQRFSLPPRKLLKAYMAERSILARARQPSLSSVSLHETLPVSHESLPIFSEEQKMRKDSVRKMLLDPLNRDTYKGFVGRSMMECPSHRWRQGGSAAYGGHWRSPPVHTPFSRTNLVVLQDIERFSNELTLLWSRAALWEEETEDNDMTSTEMQRSSPRMTRDDLSRIAGVGTGAERAETASSSLTCSSQLGGWHNRRFPEKECRRPSMRKVKEERDQAMSPRCILEEMGYYARQLAVVMMRIATEATDCNPLPNQIVLPTEGTGHVSGEAKEFSSHKSDHISVESTDSKDEHANHTLCTPSSSSASALKSSLSNPSPTAGALRNKTPMIFHSSIKNRQSKCDKRKRINANGCQEESNKKTEEEYTDSVLASMEATTEQECDARNECGTIGGTNSDALHFHCYQLEEEKEKKQKECLAPKKVSLHFITLLQQSFLHFLRSLSPVTLTMEGGAIVEWWLSFPFLCMCWKEWRNPSEKQEWIEENKATEDASAESDEKISKSSKRKETTTSSSAAPSTILYHHRLHRAHLWDLFRLLIATLHQWCAEVPSSHVSSAPFSQAPTPPPTFPCSLDLTENFRNLSSSPCLSTDSNGVSGANPNATSGRLSAFPPNSSCHPISLVYAIHSVALYYHYCFARSGELTNMTEEEEAADLLFPTTTTTLNDNSVKPPFSTRSLSSPSSSWRMLHELCEAMIHVATVLPLPYLLPPSSGSQGTAEQFFFRHCQSLSREKESNSMEDSAQHDFTARCPFAASSHTAPYCTLFSLVLEIIIQVHHLHLKERKHDPKNSNWKPFSISSSQAFFSRMVFLQDVYDIQTSSEDGSDNCTSLVSLVSSVGNTFVEKPTKKADLFSIPEFYGIPETIQRFYSLTEAL